MAHFLSGGKAGRHDVQTREGAQLLRASSLRAMRIYVGSKRLSMSKG